MRTFFACLPMLFLASAGSAAVWNVPDAERGIVKIQDALARAVAGDVLNINTGQYSEFLDISVSNLTLRGVGGPVMINGTPSAGSVGPVPAISIVSQTGVVLEGIHMRGRESGYYPDMHGKPGLYIATSEVFVKNCSIFGGARSGQPGILSVSSALRLEGVSATGGSGQTGSEVLVHLPYPGYRIARLPFPGGCGIEIHGGSVDAVDCTFTGLRGEAGAAGSIWHTALQTPTVGGEGALVISGAAVRFEGCRFTGGDGGVGPIDRWSTPSARAGHGLWVRVSSSALVTGACSRPGANLPTYPDGPSRAYLADATSQLILDPSGLPVAGSLLTSASTSEVDLPGRDKNGDGAVDASDVLLANPCGW